MDKKYFLRYFTNIFIISSLLIILGTILFKTFNLDNGIGQLFFLVILFLFINSIAHLLLIKNSKSKPGKFISTFMVISIIKILVYISILILYILTLTTGLKLFLLSFLTTYLTFTTFEVIELSKFLKNTTSK